MYTGRGCISTFVEYFQPHPREFFAMLKDQKPALKPGRHAEGLFPGKDLFAWLQR